MEVPTRPIEAPRSAFAGFRFPAEVTVVAVRWYLRYGLSCRDVEELLAERGIEVVRRDAVAARRFFTRALRTLKVTPSEVVTRWEPITVNWNADYDRCGDCRLIGQRRP
jgi:transposase-like protein